jgi:O-antigen/teichoic acid export membrane protein
MILPFLHLLRASIRDLLNKFPGQNNIISNTGWLLADNILRVGVGFFVNAWIIRYLGPERFGLLSYAIAFIALFTPVAQLGLDAVIVRNIVNSPTQRNEILGSAFAMKLAGAVLTIFLTMAAIFMLRPEDRLTQSLVGICILGTLMQPFAVIDFWFQSQMKAKYSVMAKSSACITFYAIKVILILVGASLLAFAWVGFAELILGSTGLVLAYRITGQHIGSWKPTKKMMILLLRDSCLLMASDLVYYVYLRIDRIIIGEISGPAELGLYSVAVMAAEAFFFIAQSASLSIFPGVVEAQSVSLGLFREKMQQYYKLMVFLGYAVAIPLSLVSSWLVPLLFGSEYEKAIPMLILLVWGGVFLNLIHARSYYLAAMNWTRLHLVLDLIGCAANISLNIFLIPIYGGIGAAIASIMTYFLTAYVINFTVKPLRENGIMMTKALLYPKFW